ncbi:hypothetical protein BDP27DRAFT_1419446 [Rhodocollybia butyracea]|uniref:Uncharacterized protein n=1 Tax=Rhodocollybia butyracea TaxID=206335 RepID=A0A9P5U9F5_9AGAR|nr:hypothetical protein BDP27DRAFT_1419446 [Rhodocollybia butyracea]
MKNEYLNGKESAFDQTMSSSPPAKTKKQFVSEAVLGFLNSNGPASTSGRKAVEIYSTAQRRKEHKEEWRQLASVACDLVYALLKSFEGISLQDDTINQAVESLLNRILHAVRTDHASSNTSTNMPYRSLLRRNPPVSEAQLQSYMDQLYNFQAWLTLSQRIIVLEDWTRLDASAPSRNITPPRPAEHPSEARTFTPPNQVRCNSNNPFLPLIGRGVSPREVSSGVAPFAPFVSHATTDNPLRTSHIGGSSSTISKVDNSTLLMLITSMAISSYPLFRHLVFIPAAVIMFMAEMVLRVEHMADGPPYLVLEATNLAWSSALNFLSRILDQPFPRVGD